MGMGADAKGARVLPLMLWENVLFPGMLLPLQVRQSKYVLLINHCLDRQGEFGMVLESDHPGRPRQVGTVARIIDYQLQEDGEITLLVTGLERFAVAELIDDDPWLTAMVEPYELVGDASAEELDARAVQARRLFNRCVRLIASHRGGDSNIELPLPEQTANLTWAIASSLPLPPEERQRLLEKETPASLLQSEILYLRSLLSELRDQVGGEG
jgi:Lon protease-like protein